MATQTYCLRTSNEVVIAAIAAYAKEHGIPESTAIGRMLAEGLKLASGAPVSRFAVIDANAKEIYSLALGEIRDLAHVLKRCYGALSRPRPVDAEERKVWQEDKEAARLALHAVMPALRKLKKAGKLEFIMNEVDVEGVEVLYAKAMQDKAPRRSAIYGALLGKPSYQGPNPHTGAHDGGPAKATGANSGFLAPQPIAGSAGNSQ